MVDDRVVHTSELSLWQARFEGATAELSALRLAVRD